MYTLYHHISPIATSQELQMAFPKLIACNSHFFGNKPHPKYSQVKVGSCNDLSSLGPDQPMEADMDGFDDQYDGKKPASGN